MESKEDDWMRIPAVQGGLTQRLSFIEAFTPAKDGSL